MNRSLSRRVAVSCLLALLASSTRSFAQEQDKTKQETKSAREALVEKQPLAKAETGKRLETPTEDKFRFLEAKYAFSKLVKSAPYSATVVTETIQMLADGNEISRRLETKMCRDSEGRTRREQILDTVAKYRAAGDPPRLIFIDDPVAGLNFTLDPRTRIARRMKQPARPLAQGFYRGERSAESQPSAEPRPKMSGSGEPKLMPQPKLTLKQEKAAKGDIKELPAGATKKDATLPSGQDSLVKSKDGRLGSGSSDRKKTESLGKQVIEGVEAEGTRSTVTIPAGEIGNRLSIEVTEERWYSPELQILIMRKHHDPRSGDTVYRLTNIDRTEPDRTLFEVPPDYRLAWTGSEGNVFRSTPQPKRVY